MRRAFREENPDVVPQGPVGYVLVVELDHLPEPGSGMSQAPATLRVMPGPQVEAAPVPALDAAILVEGG